MIIYIGKPEWGDWEVHINRLKIDGWEITRSITSEADIILPLKLSEMTKSMTKGVTNRKFCPDTATLNLLDNKYSFINWMIQNGFKDYVAPLIKANIDKKIHICDVNRDKGEYEEYIVKKIKGCGGISSFMTTNIDYALDNNTMMQVFIRGNHEYAGHFCVNKGVIIRSVYFLEKQPTDKTILRGKLKNYTIVQVDHSVFSRIFLLLNYTGFACIDFKIIDDKPCIFEINPRLGGSIVTNDEQFGLMIDALCMQYKKE